MEKKKVVHVISHSHWDREWYMGFEEHRMKLVDLIDDCMELFEKNDGFRSFHLDGQTIVLDDYLEVCPEKREQLKQYTRDGRFQVGPWYILQDEFLTSGEANIRNLLVGLQEADRFGPVCMVGYFPDAFGNAGQMPQLLKQAGIKAVAFGRGVKPVGFNNELKEGGEYESSYSEIQWESPDGSRLLGILFANWYNNGAEIPAEEEAARAYWDKKLADAERFASTRHLLFLNGCDHQPVQKDLAAALETASRLYPEYEFVHSNFPEYVKCVQEEQSEDMNVIRGELTSQETDGWYTLVNTCSSRVYLKVMNRETEVKLERIAEPLSAIAARYAKAYPHDKLRHGWKLLMQNHPHDSICGCSIDEVNDEMETRYHQSTQVAEAIGKESREYLSELVDTKAFGNTAGESHPFVIWNTTGFERSKVVSVTIDVDREYDMAPWDGYDRMEERKLPEYRVVDREGNTLEAVIEDAGVRFGYDLPDNAFRKAYMARTVRVTFEACGIPAMGYKSYALQEKTEKAECVRRQEQETLVKEPGGMENDWLKVSINVDGTLEVLDRESGRQYHKLCYFEEQGDIGNEYIFCAPKGTEPITTLGQNAVVVLKENTSFRAVYEIRNVMEIPISADETLLKEQMRTTEFKYRKAQRSKETTSFEIVTEVSLEKHSRALRFLTRINNNVKDHRVRVMIPTGLHCSTHQAETVLELVERRNRHSEIWENPSGCEHQQSFMSMNDGKAGITVANVGLYEYEVLPEQENTVALTLLRAVGEMGDWGYFPTPGAQILRSCDLEYALIFHQGSAVQAASYADAWQFQTPIDFCQTLVHEGRLEPEQGFIEYSGKGIALSAMKIRDRGDDLILRFVNMGDDSVLKLRRPEGAKSVYRSNVVEEMLEMLDASKDMMEIPIGRAEILTVGIGM